MQFWKILLISTLVSSCASNGLKGHWSFEDKAGKIGLVLHSNSKCTAYVEPKTPHHSVLASTCEYEVNGNDYLIYVLKYGGGRHPAMKHVYSQESKSFTLTVEDPEEGKKVYVLTKNESH